ncbi:MAG: hypothetical protein J0M17_07325, partial [Planctomycetes bacterium]|nr:hypothetical protein [Planctomycetota bacterium]
MHQARTTAVQSSTTQQGPYSPRSPGVRSTQKNARQDPAWVRFLLTALAVGIVGVLIVVPVAHVFYQALKPGWATYWHNLTGDAETRHAIMLTLL